MSTQNAPDALRQKDALGKERTLFDCNLPDEVVEHIVYFLSKRLRHVYPQCFVEALDVLTILGASEKQRAAALKSFRSVKKIMKINRCANASYDLNGAPPGALLA